MKNILIISQSIYNYQNYNREIEIAISLKKKKFNVKILTTSQTVSFKRVKKTDRGIEIILSPEIFPAKFRIGQLGIIDTIFRIYFCLKNDFTIYHFEGHKPTILFPFLFTKLLKPNKIYVNEWMDWFGNEGRLSVNPIVIYDKLVQIRFRKFFDSTIVISKYLFRLLKIKKIENVLYLPTGVRKNSQLFERRINRVKNLTDNVKICFIKVDKDDINDLNFAINSLKVLASKTNKKLEVFITSKMDLTSILDKHNKLYENLNFKFLGYIENYWEFLSFMDIALLPFLKSRKNFAKYPNKFNDFISIGLPTVFNPTGELLYLSQKFNFGTVDNKYDIHNFSSIILKLINDKKFYEAESRKLHNAAKNLDWDVKINELVKVYNDLIEKNK